MGAGVLEIAALVEICRKANPDVRFFLEMITRDPLSIPCLTQTYRSTFADFPERDLQLTLDLARRGDGAGLALPYDTGDPEALALEERLIRESLDWWELFLVLGS